MSMSVHLIKEIRGAHGANRNSFDFSWFQTHYPQLTSLWGMLTLNVLNQDTITTTVSILNRV